MSDEIEPTVTVRLTLSEAERLSWGLSDLLCWCRGFVAACPEDTGRHPYNFATALDVRERIDKAIREHKEPF